MNKPMSWIKGLNEALSLTRCKVAGREAPLEEGLNALMQELLDARSRDASVWWVGNGGSASLCAHFSQDIVNKMKVRSFAFMDAALLTCMSNDYGYSEVFRRPLDTMARAGDVLVVISSSGESENILRCAELAHENGLRLITVSAFQSDNSLWHHEANVSLHMPCQHYGIAETGHSILLHAVIETMWLQQLEVKISTTSTND